MTYILTTLLFILGVGYHVMQIVMGLRKKFPQFGFREIFGSFFNQEWDSLIRSLLVLCTYELGLFIIGMTGIHMPVWWEKYLVVYVLALVLGYAGQRIAYKYLGTAADVLEKKSELIKTNGEKMIP